MDHTPPSLPAPRSDRTGRKLRLLVIHDTPIDLTGNCRHIEVLRPRSFHGKPMARIGTWAQMVKLLFRRDLPEFDLLLIDVRFHDDETDPLYFNEDGRA